MSPPSSGSSVPLKEEPEPQVASSSCAASSSTQPVTNQTTHPPVWVFGYGSLCWNPGFAFDQSVIGYVKGYSRKLWQGSVTHRGTTAQPGRVATLIPENKDVIVWGTAFKVTVESSTFRYLQIRECSNGGYLPETVKFYAGDDDSQPPVEALTFIATSDNPLWMGDAPLPDMASQIVNAKGIAGYNVEYVLKLTDFLRNHLPTETDPEIFTLEVLILDQIRKSQLCIKKMMCGCVAGEELEEEITRRRQEQRRPSMTTNDFTTRVPEKKLRCLNI